MRSFAVVAALAASLPLALCEFPFNQFLPMHKRQDDSSDTANYECHYDCGYAIIDGRSTTTAYCTNSTWTELYDECMECAEVQDIWSDYGPYLTPIASSCGLTPVPSPATAGASATAAANATATAAGNSTVATHSPTGTATPGSSASLTGSATATAGSGSASSTSEASASASSAASAANKQVAVGATFLFGLVSSGLAALLL